MDLTFIGSWKKLFHWVLSSKLLNKLIHSLKFMTVLSLLLFYTFNWFSYLYLPGTVKKAQSQFRLIPTIMLICCYHVQYDISHHCVFGRCSVLFEWTIDSFIKFVSIEDRIPYWLSLDFPWYSEKKKRKKEKRRKFYNHIFSIATIT